MATETRDQSASWAEVSRSSFTDSARGLPGFATDIDAFPMLADRHQ
jgi:hypothetical protein